MKAILLACLVAAGSAFAQEPPPPPAPVQPDVVQPEEAVPGVSSEATTIPAGQWVFTQEYGWVYMPYNDQYVNSPQNAQYPQQYVYYPTVGWVWLISPWVWGWGPYPFYGTLGYGHYGWYGRGYYGHWYGHRGSYAVYGGPSHYYRGGRAVVVNRPYGGPRGGSGGHGGGGHGPVSHGPGPSRGGGPSHGGGGHGGHEGHR